MIWNYELKELLQEYHETKDKYTCVMCDTEFEKGRIYECEGQLCDAKRAVKHHVKEAHGSIAAYLLQQEQGVTGLSDIQNRLLTCILNGKSDKEIGTELGIAQSTVRNHRFKLREKEKQSKLFLALMDSIAAQTDKTIDKSDTGVIEEIHTTAAMVDDRYSISDQEREKTLKTYMDENGALLQFPAREKKKIIVLSEIIKNFKHDTEYTEREVNKVLKRIFEEDYPTIRRALIEYGFMDRSADCQIYRVR